MWVSYLGSEGLMKYKSRQVHECSGDGQNDKQFIDTAQDFQSIYGIAACTRASEHQVGGASGYEGSQESVYGDAQ